MSIQSVQRVLGVVAILVPAFLLVGATCSSRLQQVDLGARFDAKGSLQHHYNHQHQQELGKQQSTHHHHKQQQQQLVIRQWQRPPTQRKLLLTRCPATCERCTNSGTQGQGVACLKCANDLQVITASSADVEGDCGCVAGKYISGSGLSSACVDCPQGSYCPGGKQSPISCPDNMNTTTPGSKRIVACQNNPGYYYIPPNPGGGEPSAAVCPDNTYSPGLNRQKLCRRCPSGFVIENNNAIRTDSSGCVVPPGWYIVSAGAAARCPKGEYKAGYDLEPKCNRCPRGVTTQQTGSVKAGDCNTLKPGFNGMLDSVSTGVTTVQPCPQHHYCVQTTLTQEGVEAKISCGGGLWTRDRASKSANQCLVPPGYRYNKVANTTEKCGDGFFREGWYEKDNPNAASCTACGPNIKSEETHALTKYHDVTGAISYELVRGSAYSCYIEAGWAMYRTSDGLYRADMCTADNVYGVASRQYGLASAPCRMCPLNLKTTLAAEGWKVNGLAISPEACLTQAGYGYENRVSEICPKGSWNAAGNQNPCQDCGYGLTTATSLAGDAGADSESQCVLDAGYGTYDGVIQECPKGTYNSDGISTDGRAVGSACSDCTEGFTTESTGATDAAQCAVCAAGYGSTSCTACTSGSYSPGDSTAACASCAAATTFYFFFSGVTDAQMIFTSGPVSKAKATSSSDCFAAFAQLADGSSLAISSGPVVTVAEATNHSTCVAACTEDCQFVNFDYASNTCSKRMATAGARGDGTYFVLAVKTVFAGDVDSGSVQGSSVQNKPGSPTGTSPAAAAAGSPAPKSYGSGMFSFWVDSTADGVGVYTAAGTGVSRTVCLDTCTTDPSCAAVRIAYSSDKAFVGCGYVRGAVVTDGTVRTLLRAVPAQLTVPAGYVDAQ